jgi:7-cyano-7-deazaguanine reductase
MDKWSDITILKSLKNPTNHKCKITITTQEITILGAKEQPDFANLTILYSPREKIIELKSLKFYLFQFRNKLLSYERLIDIIYNDIQTVYCPDQVGIILEFKPRGGISSKLEIGSIN